MSSHHLLVILVVCGLIGGGLLDSPASAQGQAAPAMTTSPPQQMPANGVPATYPSTYPSTYPATAYPSMSAVGPYPSTSVPSAGSAAFASYNTAMPGATPSASNGAGGVVLSQLPGDQGGLQPSYSGVPGPVYAPYGSPDPATAAQSFDANAYVERSLGGGDDSRTWQILPNGLMYKSYLAGDREPRFGTQFVHLRTQGWMWDSTLGARVGLLRYGSDNDLWPQGWQWDVEGAAFPRLNLEDNRNLVDYDYRAGTAITTRQGPFEMKFGYYHYCSHIGDEYLLDHPDFDRLNYVRETLILGLAAYVNPSLRLYWETGWAFSVEGPAKPWEFQFGADFCSNEPTGPAGAPFFAINGHLHEETNFSGNLTVQTGWMWRGRSGHLFRVGMQYFNGMSDEAQFYNTFEEQIGIGLWYDF